MFREIPKIDRATVAIVTAIAAALTAGILLRTVALGTVPAGFHQDEACNGYDAFCLLKTGRDQHGNLLPLVMQAFNDYRMALFDYSLVPLIGLFGLKVWVVRFGAALWGIADLVAVAILAVQLIDIRAAPIAVALTAISPWHLVLSRYGAEVTAASATIDWALVCFLNGINGRRGKWLAASGFLFGTSLYSYSTTKLFTPLIAVWFLAVFWRDVRVMKSWVIALVAVAGVMAIPQAWLIIANPTAMQARFNQLSILSEPGAHLRAALNWLFHFSPDFLIGGLNPLFHEPRGLSPLIPAEALMAIAAIAALFNSKRRRTALLLIGWIAAASAPGAILKPAPVPNPFHDFFVIVPWSLMAALGMVMLLDIPLQTLVSTAIWAQEARVAVFASVAILALIQATIWINYYFTGFSADRVSLFQAGVAELLRNAEKLAAPDEIIVFPLTFREGYIYPLFYDAYPPRHFQSERIERDSGLFGRVHAFDRYRYENPWRAFHQLPHGVFIFPKVHFAPEIMGRGFPYWDRGPAVFPAPPVPPAMTFSFGENAYSIVVK